MSAAKLTKANGVSASQGLKVEYVRWLMDPHREGSQNDWAAAHDLHFSTISHWKHEDPFVLDLIKRWQEYYDVVIAEGAQNMARISVDPDHPLTVQAFRTLADLMGKFAPKRVDVTFHTVVDFLRDEAEHFKEPKQLGDGRTS